MLTVPLTAVAAQSLTVNLGGQVCQINLYTLDVPAFLLGTYVQVSTGSATADSGYITADTGTVTADTGLQTVFEPAATDGSALYMDLLVGGAPIITGKICRNCVPMLLNCAYLGVVGDFVFVDTQSANPLNGSDPVYTGLGTQFQLVYLEASDLAEAA